MRAENKTVWRHWVVACVAGSVVTCGLNLHAQEADTGTKRNTRVNASITYGTGVLSGGRLSIAPTSHAYRVDTVISRDGSGFLPQSMSREDIDAMGGSVAGLTCRFDEQCDDCSGCTDDVCVITVGLEGVCEQTPIDLCEQCDDDLFCTGTERCNGTDATCLSDGDPCVGLPEICDELAGDGQSGECVTPCQTDANCPNNVGDLCASPEVCELQECVGGDFPGLPCSSDAACPNGFCGGVCRETEGLCGDGAPCISASGLCGFGRCCTAGECARSKKADCTGDWLGIGDLTSTPDEDDAVCGIAPVTEINAGEDFRCPSYASGISPAGELVFPVGEIGAASCNAFQEIGDDYQIGDGTGFFKLTTFRMVEGFREGSRIRITIYDENGVFVEDSITDGRGGGEVQLQTFVFDEQPIIPARGFVAIKAAIRFSPTGKHVWMSTTATPDVGSNNPDLMWLNGSPAPASSILPAGVPGVLAFELIGELRSDARGACCDTATGACNLALPWICEQDGGFFQGVGTACQVCTNDFTQTCEVNSECVTCQGGGGASNNGDPCNTNADCTDGATCDLTATCETVPPACTISACCNPTSGTCIQVSGGTCSISGDPCSGNGDCPIGESCEAPCPDGTDSNGFGTTCDPNCCIQPVMTGGDLCTLATVIQIQVPLPGEPPVVITITGDNSSSTFGDWLPDGTGTCQAGRHNPDGVDKDRGWWEAFSIDACANVRVDDCCSNEISGEIKQPQWSFMWSQCDPCGASPGSGIVGGTIGFPTTNAARGDPFCQSDDLWVTYPTLAAGTYWQNIFSAPDGTFGLYQRHITVEACPEAACCLPQSMCVDDTSEKVVFVGDSPQLCAVDGDCGVDISCRTCAILNEVDCSDVAGFFNGFGFLPEGENPNVSCGFGDVGPCDIGSCCRGPGDCRDEFAEPDPDTPSTCDPAAPLTCVNRALCDTIGGLFQGGEFCDFPIPPCPNCTVQGLDNCQFPPSGAWNTSDLSMLPGGVTVADDFIPSAGTLGTVCFWGHYADQAALGIDCNGGVTDKFRIRVYADDNGFPGTMLFEQHVDNLNVEKGTEVGGGALGADGVGYTVTLDPPLTGLAQGVRHWLEIANDTDEPPGNTCVWSWQMFFDADRDEFSLIGTNDRADQGPGSGYLRQGSARAVDYAFCLGAGGGEPLNFTQPAPEDDTMSCWNCLDDICTPETLRECIGVTGANDGNLPVQNFRGEAACTDAGRPEQEGQLCFTAGAIAAQGNVCNGGAPNGTLDPGEECDDGDDTDPFDGCTGCALTCETTPPVVGGDGAKIIGNGLFSFDNTCAPSDGSPTIDTDFNAATEINNSVWFQYTATCTGRLIVSACPTGLIQGSFDTVMALYRDSGNPESCVCPGLSSQFQDGKGADENCQGLFVSQAGFLVRTTEPGWCWTIRVGGWQGDFGIGMLDVDCQPFACTLSSPPVLEQVVTTIGGKVSSVKNRYLSFTAGDPGQIQAIRIKTISAPPGFEGWVGSTFWVGAPTKMSELSGKDDDTPPTFTRSAVVCNLTALNEDILFRGDWSTLGTIHVTGAQIVPGATYEIAVVDKACNASSEESFPPESTVTVATSVWGDVAGPFNGNEQTWTVPEGIVSIGFDVVSILDKFKNVPTAPTKARSDIQPDPVDGKITIVDVTRSLDAFSGAKFPFSPADPNNPCP